MVTDDLGSFYMRAMEQDSALSRKVGTSDKTDY